MNVSKSCYCRLLARYNFNHYLARFLALTGRITDIGLDKLFVGGELGFYSNEWIELTGDVRRNACLLKDSCHVRFLIGLGDKGSVSDDEIRGTEYYKNAMYCVQRFGTYFEAIDEPGVVAQGRRFLSFYKSVRNGSNGDEIDHKYGHSKMKYPLFFGVFQSDYYEIYDGHHRLAIDYVLNKKATPAIVLFTRKTYLQRLVLKGAQVKGRKELYQPIESPEFMSGWHLIRKCADRYGMMTAFLKQRSDLRKDARVVDLACSYGWFVREFSNAGYSAIGIDKDPTALKVGQAAYSLSAERLLKSSVEEFIEAQREPFDIALFLSVLHHYGLGMQKHTAAEILRMLNKITRHVLFIDSGQSHEAWFKKQLKDWSDDFIEGMIRDNTDFKTVIRLGKDGDNVGKYKDNYCRTLFACIK